MQTHGLVCGLVNSEQTVDWRADFGKNPPVGIPATDISVRGAAKGLRIFSERHELASVNLDHSSTLRYLRVSKSLMLNCCLSHSKSRHWITLNCSPCKTVGSTASAAISSLKGQLGRES